MRRGHCPKERPFCRYLPAILFNLVLHSKVPEGVVVHDLPHTLAEVSFSTPPSARRSSTLLSPQQVSLFLLGVLRFVGKFLGTVRFLLLRHSSCTVCQDVHPRVPALLCSSERASSGDLSFNNKLDMNSSVMVDAVPAQVKPLSLPQVVL